MLVVMVIFAVMSYFYTYKYYNESEEDHYDDEEDEGSEYGHDEFSPSKPYDHLLAPWLPSRQLSPASSWAPRG
jgi:hypothetical protein